MSKISLQPNASGTGTFTLAAPDSNTNRTLTLPDEAGSVLTDVSNIQSQVKTATNATGSAPVYACRAWVNFDGTGTVSIRDSGNVSSITDNGTGTYTVNFATAMEDANYGVCGLCNDGTASWTRVISYGHGVFPSTGAVRCRTSISTDGSVVDHQQISVSIFR